MKKASFIGVLAAVTLMSPSAFAEDPTVSHITGPDNSAINALASLVGLSQVCMDRGLYVTEFMVDNVLLLGEKEYGNFFYSDFFSDKVEKWEQAARQQQNISNECLNFATEFNVGFNRG
ncbi:hypothetical protein AB6E30_19435 [Vibrio sp. 10N.247.311.12]|uniref:hypothetical protein n=1 Tax=Vibrio sp. 10N.247.311.12 TaxID=3229991 RepID=UPI00354E9575